MYTHKRNSLYKNLFANCQIKFMDNLQKCYIGGVRIVS